MQNRGTRAALECQAGRTSDELPFMACEPRPPSAILGQVPLAVIQGSLSIRRALKEEAGKHGLRLDIRLRFSSYPQLAQAVQTLKVAAIMPTLAAQSMPAGSYQVRQLPFLKKLSRPLSLVWNEKLAEVRPALANYAKVLALAFRQPACRPS